MSDCPSSEELLLFLSTARDEGRSPALRAHIDGCERCQRELDRLTGSVLDAWRSMARTAATEPDPESEPGLRRLLEAMRAGVSSATDDEADDVEAGPDDWRSALGPPSRPGDLGTLGPYLVEAELGRGGMGIVLRAYDPALERLVALKVLRPERAHPRARRRLVREARAAARVRHDHLVAVHGVVDPPGGLPYLVMEYLAGPSLARLIADGSGLEPRRAAELSAQVADGLAAAHAAGLVHRDVKPDNVLIDPTTGRARLTDFGLARDAAGGESLTGEDVLAGTPTHMSPEQARGQPPDGRSDVYGLGVTLYQCLTGDVPFRGAPHMVIRQVCEDDPRPPRRLNDRIPRELETITLKAMAREPSARYPTAAELRDDLRRWLRGEPIRARPPGPLGHLWRWCRRNARTAAMAAVVLGLLVLLSVVSTVAAVRIARAQRQTLRERQAARDHYKLALETLDSLVLDVNQKLGSRPGTLTLKRDILETARAGLEKIARSAEAEGSLDRGTVVAYDQLGDVLSAIGRTPEAVAAYRRSRDLAASMSAADPGAVQPRRDLALAHDKLGDVARLGGDLDAAEADYRRALSIRAALNARDGDDPMALRDVQVSTNKLGLIALARGDQAGALGHFRRSLGLLERYAPSYPSRTKVLEDTTYTYGQVADASRLGDWSSGAEAGRKAVAAALELVKAEPENLFFRKRLAVARERLGAILWLADDLDGADREFREELAVCEAQAAADPSNADSRRTIAGAHRMLGNVARSRGDFDAARARYEESLTISVELADADPGSSLKQTDALTAHAVLIGNAEDAGRFDEAVRWLDRDAAWLAAAERRKGLSPAILTWVQGLVADRQLVDRAAARGLGLDGPIDPGLPPRLLDDWRLLRATAMARRGRHAEADAEARAVLEHPTDNPFRPQAEARVYALCADAAAADPGGHDLEPRYVEAALAAIRRALRLNDAAIDVLGDPGIEPLRRRKVLQAVALEAGQAPPRDAAGK